ncbi:hypothetical protein H0H92_007545 [Tricholoma furcatifolium]|nr:hypothetical protein H0H92_007545 [Tricholoma furcatifolium]
MMLVQKPPHFHLASTPVRHHRRHPSSPPVVHVQPTRTPGLLTLSHPPTPKDQHIPASQAEGTNDPFLNNKHRQPRKRNQPINIPAPQPTPSQPAARSVPLPSHRPAKRNVVPDLLPAFNFPICDDLSDNEQPSTPTRPKQRSAPKHKQHSVASFPVAPLSSFPTPPHSSIHTPASAPHHRRRPRNHKRAPSDSGMVFHMSSDESGSEAVPNDDLNALFKNLTMSRAALRTPPPPAQREAMYEAMAQREVRGYFASSSFQNSPSPEDLPDPLLF